MKVIVVSGSRADRGLLEPVYLALREYGEAKFYLIDDSSYNDTPLGIAEKFNEALFSVTCELTENEYDLMVVLGDRFEILAAVTAAVLSGVLVAHIAGGDISLGSYDNLFRNAITQMSNFHFVTNVDASYLLTKVRGMRNVYLVGSPGLDNLEVADELSFNLGEKNMLVMHYPATLSDAKEFDEVVAAVDSMEEWTKFFILPNPDVGSHEMFVKLQGRENVFTGLNRKVFLRLLKECDVLVGNSSAGLYEAPSLGTPTVNVGMRQMGREAGPSVVHCVAEREAVIEAVGEALQVTNFTNPYYHGNAAEKIAEAIGMYEGAIMSKEILKKGWG